MKIILAITITLIFFTASSYSFQHINDHDMQWIYAGNGIKDMQLTGVSASFDNSGKILTNSKKALYRRSADGNGWNELLSFRGTSVEITSIESSPFSPNVIAAGTSDGLFISNDNGSTWTKAFHGIGSNENFIFSISFSPLSNMHIFTGTASGLFISTDNGSSWVRNQSLPSNKAVTGITVGDDNPTVIYASLNNVLYKSIDNGKMWQTIFTLPYKDPRDDETIMNNEDISSTDVLLESMKIKKTIIAPNGNNTIYLATSEGLFISKDSGIAWKHASNSGLISGDIKHMIIDPEKRCCLYAATGRGIFRYSNDSDRWTQSYSGLDTVNINQLAYTFEAAGETASIWAATDKGIYKSAVNTHIIKTEYSADDPEEITSYFDNEPTIEDIQKAAIIYAEVHPDKINKWRKNAARKAWLPNLRVDFGEGKDWQSSTYFYSTSTTKYTDDDITEGKDKGWSVSLAWDLGDIIWSSDQTSIDTRSRLMVQLRDDVLNEVTRLYYERRRLQIEILLQPGTDTWKRIERSLRLQELTADIDAMTGFSFSELSAKEPPKTKVFN